MKSKDLIRISIIIGLVIVAITIYSFINKTPNNPSEESKEPTAVIQNYKIVLFGQTDITLYEGDEYQEQGYYALLNNQEIVTNEVEVQNNINTQKPGEYVITYKIGNEAKIRNIKVIAKPTQDIEDIRLELIGNQTVELYVGDTYIDSGCLAFDKDNNNISSKIVTDNRVNTNKSGTYYVIYSIFENDKWKNIQRKVVVNEKEVITQLSLDASYNHNPTNQDVVVNLKAEGTDFAYIKVPNGNRLAVKETTYNISENGTYYFYVYDLNNNYETKIVEINNIDKTVPTATCDAKINFSKTEITVKANDNSGIKNYIYNVNGSKIESTLAKFTINEKQNPIVVSIVDNAGNQKDISCNVKSSNLEMHFIAGVSDDDAILIRTDDKVIMIDGGRYDARTKVVNYLKKLGVEKIDAMFGSHVHWNHVQAQAAILDNFEVDNLYYPVDIMNCVSLKHCVSNDVLYIKDKIKEKKLSPKIIKVNNTLEIGDMKLYFIGPVRGIFTTYENANSSVFILEYGNKKFMFTGDTPSAYMNTSKFKENAKKLGTNIDIDVLKWPHHGYEDLTDAFFKATTPNYAIIPNCCWCSSKYPSTTNKNLMKKYNTKYYQVCDGKNIVLTTDGDTINIKTNQNANDYKR